MGRGVFISGLVLGILGVLWSIFLFFIFLLALVLTFGQGGALLAIPGIGFVAAIMAIVGGALGRKRTVMGAYLLLGAGAAVIVTTVIVWFVLDLSASVLTTLTLLSGWWAYGLIIASIVSLLLGRREGQASSHAPAS